MSKLLSLKEWVTVSEAARHLSGVCGEPVDEPDVLRLALDGHLTLSVNFVNHARVRRGTVVPLEKARTNIIARDLGNPIDKSVIDKLESAASAYGDDRELPLEVVEGLQDGSLIHFVCDLHLSENEFLHLEDTVVSVDGIWDLPMIGAERLDVEHRYQQLTGGPDVTLVVLDGAFVRSSDGSICQLQERFDTNEMKEITKQVREELVAKGVTQELKDPARSPNFNDPRNYFPAGALPADSVFVVRTSALMALQKKLLDDAGDSAPSLEAKALAPKSESAYLNAIGALLSLLRLKAGTGKALYPSDAAVIAAIRAEQGGRHGLSERELQQKFAAAKRSLADD
jgi:hypothetical protein